MLTVGIFQLLLIVSIVSLLCVKKNLNIPFENKGLEFQLVYIDGIPLISFPRILCID